MNAAQKSIYKIAINAGVRNCEETTIEILQRLAKKTRDFETLCHVANIMHKDDCNMSQAIHRFVDEKTKDYEARNACTEWGRLYEIRSLWTDSELEEDEEA